MKFASWSARNTAHSLPGCGSRAATTARQARAVALTRSLGVGRERHPVAAEVQLAERAAQRRVAALPRTATALSVSPISTSRQSSWAP